MTWDSLTDDQGVALTAAGELENAREIRAMASTGSLFDQTASFLEYGWTIDDADRNNQIFQEQLDAGVQIAELRLACLLENGADSSCDQVSESVSVPSTPIGPRQAATLRDLVAVAPDLLVGEIRPDMTWDSLTDDQMAAIDGIENFDGH